MGAKRLTFKEQLMCMEMLNRWMEPTQESGIWIYKDKHSDESICSEMRNAGVRHCNPGHVAGLRVKLDRQLRKPPKADEVLEARLRSAEAHIAYLVDEIMHIEKFLTDKHGVDWQMQKALVARKNSGGNGADRPESAQ